MFKASLLSGLVVIAAVTVLLVMYETDEQRFKKNYPFEHLFI